MLTKRTIMPLLVIVLWLLPGLSQAQLNVFACEPEWAALAEEIGSNRLNIYAATGHMQDPHHIQARPSLIARARSADLLLCTGAELEVGWLPLLLRKAANARIQPGQPGYFLATDYVPMRGVPEKLDRSLGDVHAEGNPHIHTDPENILLVAAALSQRLSEIDAENADYYATRYAAFAQQWRQQIQHWQQQTAFLRGRNVVNHHNFWSYMNHWLGLNVLATLEPVAGVAPSSSHLAKIKKQLQGRDLKMIFHVSYVNGRPAEWLSEQTGTAVIALPATVDYQNGQTLSQWFDGIMMQLVKIK